MTAGSRERQRGGSAGTAGPAETAEPAGAPGAAGTVGTTEPAGAPGAAGTVGTHGYIAHGDKDALLRRMRRIEGQARGIEKMIAEERYCIDILTQIAAIDTALEAVAFKILDDHVNHCVKGALASGDEAVAAEKSKELLDAVHRFARTR